MYHVARFAAPYAAQYAMRQTWQMYQRSSKRARRFGPADPVTEVGSGGQQLSYSRIKHGKRVRKREMLMRILASKLNVVSHRWQNITNSASGSGAYPLNYAANAAPESEFPVYLWDLTVAQQQIIGGVVQFGVPASRLYRNTAGHYNTNRIFGRDADNTVDSSIWVIERNSGVTNTKEYSVGLIENVSIKLLLYGARKFPSKVTISLVSFAEGYTPNAWVVTTNINNPPTVDEQEPSVADPDEVLNDWNAMWQSYTAPLIGNPISTRPGTTRNLMKIHKSKTYDFQPKLSTELDATGDQVAVYFDYKMNKRVDYTRAQFSTDVGVSEELDPNEWGIKQDQELQVHARPEQRMFLMVTGMTPLNTNGVANGAIDYAPSFDICIRRKISSMDG